MSVELAPLPQTHARNLASRPGRERKGSRMVADAPRPTLEPGETVQAPSPPATVPNGARQALRYLVGCERAAFFGLSSEERQHCEDQLAANRKRSPPLTFNLAPRPGYVSDPEPYHNRKPTNGCKVRAAGDDTPMGGQGAAGGVSCARPF